MNVPATLSETSDAEPCAQVPPEPEEKRVPTQARLWGFVRRTANENDNSVGLRDTDVALWLDEESYRFLVAAGRAVKDDLAPMEFIQFIRKLKHSHSQTLFKLGNSFDRTPRRATVVWSRPVANVIVFPAKIRLQVSAAAKPAEHHRPAGGAPVMPAGTATPRRARVGSAAARFS
jgi:hypothetical protein